MKNTHSRAADVAAHRCGALSVRSGVVAGRVVQFARALDADVASVLDAVARSDVPVLVDTGQSKPNESHDRPTDPALRSLAISVAAFARLADIVARGTRDHAQTGDVNASTPALLDDALPIMPQRELTEAVRTRVSPALKRAVDAVAKASGRTTSGWIRRVLRQRVEIERDIHDLDAAPPDRL
jgi:hypothetical protein